ncbi:MAG: Ig-like domain-containing protein, partial [Flavobacteriales bacterium]
MGYKKGVYLFSMLLAIFLLISCNDDNNNNTEKSLIITDAAQTLEPGQSHTFHAQFVNDDGSTSKPKSINWSSSNANKCNVSASGKVSTNGQGNATITAEVNDGDNTYKAKAMVNIVLPQSFNVVPGAAVLPPNESITLNPVFFNDENVSYSYSSSNSSIASVSSSGKVSTSSVGKTVITVTASTSDGDLTTNVPVLVVEPPKASLPVTRVKVTPMSNDIFRDQQVLLSAKAFDANGNKKSV